MSCFSLRIRSRCRFSWCSVWYRSPCSHRWVVSYSLGLIHVDVCCGWYKINRAESKSKNRRLSFYSYGFPHVRVSGRRIYHGSTHTWDTIQSSEMKIVGRRSYTSRVCMHSSMNICCENCRRKIVTRYVRKLNFSGMSGRGRLLAWRSSGQQ